MIRRFIVLGIALVGQAVAPRSLDVPARTLPVPDDISPAMQAIVGAPLQVFEGQSHAHYMRDGNAPETREAFEEIARFFDKHLAK